MVKKKYLIVVSFILAVSLQACGSSSSTASATDDVSINSGAMVAAVFSSSGQANISKALIQKVVQNVIKQQTIPTTCESLDSEEGPSNVTSSAQGESGTYGAASDPAIVTEDESFCQDSDGTDVSGDNLFASFTVSSAIVTCDDATSATMSGTGIWRQIPDSDFCPEIYGTFTIESNGETGEADCTIRMSCSGEEEGSDAGVVLEATCSNADGETITLSDDVTCEIDAG